MTSDDSADGCVVAIEVGSAVVFGGGEALLDVDAFPAGLLQAARANSVKTMPIERRFERRCTSSLFGSVGQLSIA